MSADDDSQREDVAGLFRKFGGDVRDYKEFAPSAEPARPSGAWPLLNGLRPGAAANEGVPPHDVPDTARAPHAPVAPAATAAPEPWPAPPVAAQVPVPVPMPMPAAPATPAAATDISGTAPPRELDALFHRLAGSPAGATPAQGLMARWRRPG